MGRGCPVDSAVPGAFALRRTRDGAVRGEMRCGLGGRSRPLGLPACDWRGARAAEGAGFENQCAGDCTGGSNPPLSDFLRRKTPIFIDLRHTPPSPRFAHQSQSKPPKDANGCNIGCNTFRMSGLRRSAKSTPIAPPPHRPSMPTRRRGVDRILRDRTGRVHHRTARSGYGRQCRRRPATETRRS